MDKTTVIALGLGALVLLQILGLWVCYTQGSGIRYLMANIDRVVRMLKDLPPSMLEASKGHEWTKCKNYGTGGIIDPDKEKLAEDLAVKHGLRPEPTPAPPKPEVKIVVKSDITFDAKRLAEAMAGLARLRGKMNYDPMLGFTETYSQVADHRERLAVMRRKLTHLMKGLYEMCGPGTHKSLLARFDCEKLADVTNDIIEPLYREAYRCALYIANNTKDRGRTSAVQLLLQIPDPDQLFPPPKEAPMQDEPQTAAGESTALHQIANSMQANLNAILDEYLNVEGGYTTTTNKAVDQLRSLLNTGLVHALERDLAHQALEFRENINQLTARNETLENQILGLTQQHKAELETLDEMHTRNLDQSVRATVAVVLEQVGQRSITLDLGKIQTVWHRLDLSMHLVPGESMGVKYTIDHYKASNT